MPGISNRIFGADIRNEIKQKLAFRQEFNKSADFGEAVEFVRNSYPTDNNDGLGQYISNFTQFNKEEVLADLSSRTPFARMWTAVELFKPGHTDEESETSSEEQVFETQVYEVGNHIYNTFQVEKTDILNSRTTLGKNKSGIAQHVIPNVHETQVLSEQGVGNEFMRPPAGITSITSETEDSMGLTKRTTINFVVHNFHDFDAIYNRYFLRPGAQVFIDFGWDTSILYNPFNVINKKVTTSRPGKFDPDSEIEPISINGMLYGHGGYVTDSNGDLETLVGFVTNYDAKVKGNGSIECMVEIVSQNSALLSNDFGEDDTMKIRILASLENEIIKFAAGQLSEKEGDFAHQISKAEWNASVEHQEDWETIFNRFSYEYLGGGFGTTEGGAAPYPSKGSLITGVYWAGKDINSRSIYVNWGVFEDIILNVEFGLSEDEETQLSDEDAIIFDSRNSFIRYSTNFFSAQTNSSLFRESGGQLKFIYPQLPLRSSEDRFNKRFNKEPDNNNWEDITLKNGDKIIPLRELFISMEMIRNSIRSSKSIRQLIEMILEQINESSGNLYNLKLATNDYASRRLSVIDQHLPWFDVTNDSDDETFFNKLFEFKPTSPNSIINSYDLSFSMPTDDIGNLIAIKAMSGDGKGIIPLTDSVEKNLSLNGIQDIDLNDYSTRNVPKLGSYPVDSVEHAEAKGKVGVLLNFSRHVPDLMGGDPNVKSVLDKMSSEDPSLRSEASEIETLISKGPGVTTGKKKENEFVPVDNDKHAEIEQLVYETSMVKSVSDYYRQIATGEIYVKNNSTILPITLAISIYGISSLVPGDLFKVDYLPNMYRKNVYFQITKVTHMINSQGWVTNLETVMRLRSTKKEIIQNFNTDGVHNVAINKSILDNEIGKDGKDHLLNNLKQHMRHLRPATISLVDDNKSQSGIKGAKILEFTGAPSVFGGDGKFFGYGDRYESTNASKPFHPAYGGFWIRKKIKESKLNWKKDIMIDYIEKQYIPRTTNDDPPGLYTQTHGMVGPNGEPTLGKSGTGEGFMHHLWLPSDEVKHPNEEYQDKEIWYNLFYSWVVQIREDVDYVIVYNGDFWITVPRSVFNINKKWFSYIVSTATEIAPMKVSDVMIHKDKLQRQFDQDVYGQPPIVS